MSVRFGNGEPAASRDELTLVQNWFRSLEAKVPVK
jgi:hypothetical protein